MYLPFIFPKILTCGTFCFHFLLFYCFSNFMDYWNLTTSCFWLVGLSFQWLLRFGCFVSTILLPEIGHHLQLVLEADQSVLLPRSKHLNSCFYIVVCVNQSSLVSISSMTLLSAGLSCAQLCRKLAQGKISGQTKPQNNLMIHYLLIFFFPSPYRKSKAWWLFWAWFYKTNTTHFVASEQFCTVVSIKNLFCL